ncbi:MAG: HD domain-containing phosphohydrolase, partial [Gemmatimonadota bacterium]|nr:HD domain-containing phosphohydrolase [Gemmatimonadota bacterium]
LQHHEHYDGTGYPHGLDSRNIHIYSRYTTLADVYDALTSDRSFKKRLPPHIAIEYIRMGRGSQFDPDCLDTFIKHIAFYPTGSTVLLNTGQKAVVVSNDPEKLERPKVRILTSPDGSQLSKPFEIDLAVTRDYKIESVES